MSFKPFYPKPAYQYYKEYDEYLKALDSGMLYSKRDWEGYYECQADYEMELAQERHFENRGFNEARLQEQMEQRAGVIPFHVAIRRNLGDD